MRSEANVPFASRHPAARFAGHDALHDEVALAQHRGARSSRSMRGADVGAARRVSVTCCPTTGARLLSNASMNCSTSRRCWLLWKPTPVRRSGRCGRRSRSGSGRACRRCRRAGSRSRGSGRPGTAVLSGVIARRRRGHAEHADLLVEVAQVRDLDDLLLVLEARVAVGAEVSELRLEPVAAVAGEAELLAEDRARECRRTRRGPRKKLWPAAARR